MAWARAWRVAAEEISESSSMTTGAPLTNQRGQRQAQVLGPHLGGRLDVLVDPDVNVV